MTEATKDLVVAPTVDLTKYVPKEDYDKLQGTVKNLQADYERKSLELLSPSYIDFLEQQKTKTQQSTQVTFALDTLTVDEIERLPKARLLQLAEERVTAKLTPVLRKEFLGTINALQEQVSYLNAREEVRAVETEFPDFDKYRDEVAKELNGEEGKTLSIRDATLRVMQRHEKDEKNDKTQDKPKPKGGEKPNQGGPTPDIADKSFKDQKEADKATAGYIIDKYGLSGDRI